MASPQAQYLIIDDSNSERVIAVIKKLMEHRRTATLRRILNQFHPNQLAGVWKAFDENEASMIISLLHQDHISELISELEPEDRLEIFKSKDTEWIVDRLESLDSDDIVDILKGVSKWEARLIMRRFDADYSRKIKELMKYPEETAGSLMTSEFLAVQRKASISGIIRQFRKFTEEEQIEDLHFVYVVDKENHLLGYIPLRKLLLEQPKKKAEEIMAIPPVTVTPYMDQETVASYFRDYNLISVPVIDETGVLLGRITVDDIVDVLDAEASEDVFKMVGLGKDEKLTDKIFTSFKNRLPWMFINLLTTSASAAIIYFFTGILKNYIILAIFMPMIAALGGATGNQMVALTVRGLALGDLTWRQVRWILLREAAAVAMGALLIGIISASAAYALDEHLALSVIIVCSLILNMILATLVGAGIPLILRFFRIDPALGSSILVSAMTDIMGFFIFLFLATRFL